MSYDVEPFRDAHRQNPDIMREIMRLYREEAPQRLETVRQGLAGSDFDAIAGAAHSLANTSGTLQCPEAVSAAHALEEAARRADAEACRGEFDRLEPLVSEVVERLGEALAGEDKEPTG